MTLVVTSLALLAAVLGNFRNAGIVIAALVAAGLVDIVLLGMRRFGGSLRAQELALAWLLPLLLWPGQLLAINMARSVLWSPEMVIGVVIVSAMVSFAVVFVLPRTPVTAGDVREEPPSPGA